MPRYEETLLDAAPERSRGRRIAAAVLGTVAVAGVVALGVLHFTSKSNVAAVPGTGGTDSRDPQVMDHTAIADEYAKWLLTYGEPGLLQSQTEMTRRIHTFAANKQIIEEHNARFAAGDETFNMTLGPFADMTAEQFTARYLDPTGAVDPSFESLPLGNDTDTPDTLAAGRGSKVDWRNKYVTRVKNQGQCGSCWAFSAAGAIEGAWAKAGHGTRNSVAPQMFVDCSRSDNGCNGGLPTHALAYAKARGWAWEQEYPYAGSDYFRCKKSSYSHSGALSGPYRVQPSNSAMFSALQKNGPISIAVDASSLQHYRSGIISRGGTRLNHAVLLVGGDSSTWTVKNSWGTSWGERGYFRVRRSNGAGVLGINQQGVYVTAH